MRLVVAVLLVSASFGAIAQDAAIEYREHTMEAVGGHMQALVAIAKGEVAHKDHLPVHVASLAALSGIAPDLFGADSKGGDALPKIWEEPEAFKKALDAFSTAAKDLDAIVKGGDMTNFGAGLGALGKSCKGCHDEFKKPE